MSKKDKQYLPVAIEYKAALITLLCIIVGFGTLHVIFVRPIANVIISGQYDKLVPLIVQILIYIDAVLASLLAILLQFIYSIKSIRKSEKKWLGVVCLLSSFAGIAALVLPPLIMILPKL